VRLRTATIIACFMAGTAILPACSRPVAPQNSCFFVQNPDGQRVSWKGNLPVQLYVHNSVPTEAYPAIDLAIAQFNQQLGNGRDVFKVVAYGVGGDLNPQQDGYSTIYWLNSWDSTKPTEQARTTIYWSGNQIFEADMRIDAANFQYNFGQDSSFSDVDLNSLLLHELGHVLGLAHNPVQGSAMNPTLDDGQVRRDLGAMDLTDLKCEY
jgi:hypothetical protein